MTDHPTIGVLALQGDVREHLRMLGGAGATALPVRRPSELAAVDGLVIPGGESTTMMKLAAAFDLLDPLRDRLAAGLPAFGTCAGMILLADTILDGATNQPTLGGLDAKVRRNAFGRQVDSFEADVTLAEVGDHPFHAVFIRAPWVESTGTGVRVIGAVEDANGASRIVAVRTGRLLATSFHPELTGDDRIHRLFVDMVKGQ